MRVSELIVVRVGAEIQALVSFYGSVIPSLELSAIKEIITMKYETCSAYQNMYP